MEWVTQILVGLFGVALGIGGTLLAIILGIFDPRRLLPSLAWGRFLGQPKAELLDDGRCLKLLEDFVYIDREGKEWRAEAGHLVDGASIPQMFWSITGGPLEGKYRNASICHDVECDFKREPWEAVHHMFYEGCRCGGVPTISAKILYMAVYHFGPRWRMVAELITEMQISSDGLRQQVQREIVRVVEDIPEAPPPDVVERLQKFVEMNNPSVEEMKSVDPRSL